MRLFIKAAILLHFFIFCLFNLNLNADPVNTRDPYKVLFIGSSYFNYNNLPDLFENLVLGSGNEVIIDQAITNGLYLADHADSPSTAAKIAEQDWDYVILQGVGSLMAYPDYYTHHPVYPALVTLRDLILENCAATRIIFCLPWAYEDGMTWVEGWTDTYVDMQIHIYNNTLQYSDEIGFEIAPVGWAWKTVLEEADFPLHYLHMSDWNHPSLRGSYLMACVVFSTVYLESSVGINFFADLPDDEVNHFQNVASYTVLENLDLWNIITTDIDVQEVPNPKIISLNQNYPNPFNPSTIISFNLAQTSIVTINIFNLKGQKIRSLINCFIAEGQHTVEWDGKDFSEAEVSSGVYYYKITAGDRMESRKMILLK